ncbi:hypothetical protein KIN20_016660 [Parelaphostrongylus tenuis]|uniref:Uncharacterized protein n=1 Tax=Parelaphostrongylus tenuis TaxID=148309 RepID=A0AAD5QQU9_PARTN|nr:hypothetical protein KIN20_016660 [Parelaphostrongylus tenuis]
MSHPSLCVTQNDNNFKTTVSDEYVHTVAKRVANQAVFIDNIYPIFVSTDSLLVVDEIRAGEKRRPSISGRVKKNEKPHLRTLDQLKQDDTAGVEATQSSFETVSRARSVVINQSKEAAQQKSQRAIKATRIELNEDADIAQETMLYHQPVPEIASGSRTRIARVTEVYIL